MINVFNLRGNCRTSGELRRKEGGNVFGLGSRTPISITLLVKKPGNNAPARIQYRDIGDYFNQIEKLQKVKDLASLLSPEMQLSSITPNEENDWLNQRDGVFDTFIPIGDKDNKDGKTIFVPYYSRGCASARDAWVYNFSEEALTRNISSMIDFYNGQIQALRTNPEQKFDFDSTKISWSDTLKQRAAKGLPLKFESSLIATAMYRPFCKQAFYYDKPVLERTYQLPRIFPTPQTKNLMICVPGIGAKKGFSALMVDCIPDVQLQYNGQCFPLHYYEHVDKEGVSLFDFGEDDYVRHDGISDFALARAREIYGPKINKEDVFYYIYGLLHSSDYRARFEADLTKMLPRIPFFEDVKLFRAYLNAGKKLAELHVNYESAKPWADAIVTGDMSCLNVEKMRFAKAGGEDDKRTIIINPRLKVENIPLLAYDYVINGKSALEWVMERYSYSVHPESKIANNPNAWGEEHGDPSYIINLLLRIITISVDTIKITSTLPALTFPEH